MNKQVLQRYLKVGQRSRKVIVGAVSSILLMFISACQPQAEYLSKNPVCQHPQNSNDHCTFTLGEHVFSLSSDDPGMPIESGVQLYLTSDTALAQVDAEVHGVSMYMGRLPVVGSLLNATLWQGDMYLGACTDPHMVWSLHLRIRTLEGEEYQHQVPFQSYVP